MPLPNASLEQATSFRDDLYCQGEYTLASDAVMSMVELLHRFNCRAALDKMDVFLANTAAYNETKYEYMSVIPHSSANKFPRLR